MRNRLLFAVWLLASCGKPSHQATDASSDTNRGLFSSPLTFPAGRDVTAVAVADLDRDGHPDVAVTNSCDTSDNTVAVLRGNGDGTLGAAQAFPVGMCPQAIVIGDFNNDGVPDIGTADGGGTVSILLGHGDGTFAAPIFGYGGGFGMSIAIGELNGDNVPDVVTAGLGARVYLGVGGGTMSSGTRVTTGDAIGAVIADFNRDGRSDVAIANLTGVSSGSVTIALGNGDGTFGPGANLLVGPNPQSVAVGDFDRDGNPDLVTANWRDGTVSVVFGNGDGTFAPQIAIPAGASTVTVGDIDGDGTADIVFAGGAKILHSNGDRTFAPIDAYACNCGKLALGDLNGDGLVDVVGVDVLQTEYGLRGGSTVSVLLQRR
jgi:hypothetical protein